MIEGTRTTIGIAPLGSRRENLGAHIDNAHFGRWVTKMVTNFRPRSAVVPAVVPAFRQGKSSSNANVLATWKRQDKGQRGPNGAQHGAG
jgi:hypothetical protein